jgi:NADPH:quinone reductase-like Zn-dependent oxidoreductase
VTAARLQPGETLLITGATGAVGGAAAAIARKMGATVIGTARKSADIPALGTAVVSQWIGLDTGDLPTSALAATGGKGANVVFDLVGGALFEPCLKSLALQGRQVAIASSEPRVSFNLIDFYHRSAQLIGVDSVKLGFGEAAEILRGLTPGIEDGSFLPPPIKVWSFAEQKRLSPLENARW